MFNTAVQKFQIFVFMGIAQQKWPIFMCNILKKFWFQFRIHVKFCAKKNYLIAVSCKTGCVLIFGISCKKKSFCTNHATDAHENRLFCGNPSPKASFATLSTELSTPSLGQGSIGKLEILLEYRHRVKFPICIWRLGILNDRQLTES